MAQLRNPARRKLAPKQAAKGPGAQHPDPSNCHSQLQPLVLPHPSHT